MEEGRRNYFLRMLQQEKQQLEQQMKRNDRFGLERSLTDSIGELSSYDNHPADAGSETFERSKDLALIDNAVAHLSDIEHALSKMEKGTYGLCEQCGKRISVERLEVIPTAKYCIEHQQARDAHIANSRPIEEDFIYPPWGSIDFDDTDHQPGYDGEDAWQAVERYGSSDTPDTYGNGEDSYNDIGMESDEAIGYVEPIEGFLVTDIGGRSADYDIVRNEEYERYIDHLDKEVDE